MNLAPRLLLLLCAVLLAACAAGGPRQKAPTSIEDRAVQRWKHLIAGEPELAWEYLTPAHKKANPRDRYSAQIRGGGMVRWTNATFLDKACASEDACKVSLRIDFDTTMPVRGVGTVSSQSTMTESWLRVDGSWYHLPDRLSR